MKGQRCVKRYWWPLALQLGAVCAGLALWSATGHAQSENPAAGAMFAGALLFTVVAFCLAFYIYTAVCLQIIARKTGTADGWLAWIPIANAILMLNIARKPIWWIVLMLIPIVNIVIAVIVWMEIAKARRKAEWWGIMVIIPIMNFIAPGYLAFSE